MVSKLITTYMRDQRIKNVKEYIYGDVLDLGCGTSEILNFVSKNKIKSYYGIDINEEVIKNNKKKFSEYRFQKLDIENYIHEIKGKYDTIVLLAFIEHCKKPKEFILNISKLLKKNGKIIFTSPTPLGNTLHTLGAYIGITHMSAVYHHYYIFNKNKLIRMLKDTNLELKEYKTFEFRLNQMGIIQRK